MIVGGLMWYFENEKECMRWKWIVEVIKGVGRFKVGGLFEFIDYNGKFFMSEMMKGRYLLVCL